MADPVRPFCPVCGQSTAYDFSVNDYAFYRCQACAFLFVYPYPSDAEIADYYNRNYRQADAAHYPKAHSRSRRARLKSLRFLPYVWRRRVLDIGCGGGFMVNAFAFFARQSHGLDISQASIDYARNRYPGCHFHCESLTAFAERGLQFDFVFSTEVLEHLPGPDEFMRTLAAVTAPQAHVYIACPDAGHPTVPADLSTWSDACPPEHLQLFNQDNLELLFNKYGFKQKRRYTKSTAAHSVLFQKAD